MSASAEFAKFLDTLTERVEVGPAVFMITLSDENKRAILYKFEDLRSDIIDEYKTIEAESRRDGRRE